MEDQDIVKDVHFEQVAEVRTDAKNRIPLGKAVLNVGEVGYYKVYLNGLGQIILDPQATIPAHEQWLFKNKKAAQLIQEGLEDAKKRRIVKAPEDFSKYLRH